jgi:hypothetical protein
MGMLQHKIRRRFSPFLNKKDYDCDSTAVFGSAPHQKEPIQPRSIANDCRALKIK